MPLSLKNLLLSKIFASSKKFALLDTFLKSKNYCITKTLGVVQICGKMCSKIQDNSTNDFGLTFLIFKLRFLHLVHRVFVKTRYRVSSLEVQNVF